MEERSSSFFFWLCLRVVGDARFLGGMQRAVLFYCKAAWGKSWMYEIPHAHVLYNITTHLTDKSFKVQSHDLI